MPVTRSAGLSCYNPSTFPGDLCRAAYVNGQSSRRITWVSKVSLDQDGIRETERDGSPGHPFHQDQDCRGVTKMNSPRDPAGKLSQDPPPALFPESFGSFMEAGSWRLHRGQLIPRKLPEGSHSPWNNSLNFLTWSCPDLTPSLPLEKKGKPGQWQGGRGRWHFPGGLLGRLEVLGSIKYV